MLRRPSKRVQRLLTGLSQLLEPSEKSVADENLTGDGGRLVIFESGDENSEPPPFVSVPSWEEP